jgi:hypothetical protein
MCGVSGLCGKACGLRQINTTGNLRMSDMRDLPVGQNQNLVAIAGAAIYQNGGLRYLGLHGGRGINMECKAAPMDPRMAAKRNRTINLPAPYLRRLWLDPSRIADRNAYPFCLPFLGDNFELGFDRPITIIVGENGTGKSTLLEGIAVLAGYDEAGGGKGYMPVDHSKAIEKMGGQLSKALRASWLPKITNGWFFRAETFFLGREISG